METFAPWREIVLFCVSRANLFWYKKPQGASREVVRQKVWPEGIGLQEIRGLRGRQEKGEIPSAVE